MSLYVATLKFLKLNIKFETTNIWLKIPVFEATNTTGDVPEASLVRYTGFHIYKGWNTLAPHQIYPVVSHLQMLSCCHWLGSLLTYNSTNTTWKSGNKRGDKSAVAEKLTANIYPGDWAASSPEIKHE